MPKFFNLFCRILAALALVLQPFAAFATPDAVLVAHPDVSEEEVLGVAQAKDMTPLSDFLDRSRPKKENSQQLKKLLEAAQGAWVRGAFDEARVKFREITTLATEDDWRDSQREAIFYSYLRLAQSSEQSLEREEWLETAAEKFPTLRTDTNAFPPPLLNEYSKIHTRVMNAAVSISGSKLFPGYRFVYVNGHRFDLHLEPTLKIPEGSHRITAFADKYPSISEVMNAQQMQIFNIDLRPLVEGSCASPKIAMKLANVALTALFKETCLAVAPAGKSFDFSPTKETEKSWARISQSHGSTATLEKRNRDWLWIGLGVLAAGATYAIVNQNQNSDARTPTHRVGF